VTFPGNAGHARRRARASARCAGRLEHLDRAGRPRGAHAYAVHRYGPDRAGRQGDPLPVPPVRCSVRAPAGRHRAGNSRPGSRAVARMAWRGAAGQGTGPIAWAANPEKKVDTVENRRLGHGNIRT